MFVGLMCAVILGIVPDIWAVSFRWSVGASCAQVPCLFVYAFI